MPIKKFIRNFNPLSRFPKLWENECQIGHDVQQFIEGKAQPPAYVGPVIKFIDTDDSIWKGNIMVVHREDLNPRLTIHDSHVCNKDPIVNRQRIFSCYNYHFTKWDIELKLGDDTCKYEYQVDFGVEGIKTFRSSFFVPGAWVNWKWLFFSCNDLSHTSGYPGYPEKYGGVVPLWADVVNKHDFENFHLMIGLGDQVYLDEVFEHVHELERWTYMANRKLRESMSATETMVESTSKWIFYYYLRHWSHPYFKRALAAIPNLFVSSDHDFMDGIGSYPEGLEQSPVMKNVNSCLRLYYLLFQQHQDPTLYFDHLQTVRGDSVTPFLKRLGNRLAVLGLDTRFERNRKRIIKKETYDWIYSQLDSLPDTFTHLVIATEIPLIFPDLRLFEKVLTTASNIKRKDWFFRAFKRSHFYKWFGFPFGEPILLSDMVDHWNSINHIEERNSFIGYLQQFALEKSIRVTFIGGDVHCAGVGRLSTPSMSKDKARAHYENNLMLPFKFATDHRLMYNIISSAIANVPPPKFVIKLYHMIDRPEKFTTPGDDTETDARMLRFFLRDTKGKVFGKSAKKLMATRNWCSVQMSSIDDSLFFRLHLEMFLGAGRTLKYDFVVPSLESKNGLAQQEMYIKNA